MKLITLNLWAGVVYEPLIEFVKKHSEYIDIFCFQEMAFGDLPNFTLVNKARINLFSEFSDILVDFVPYKYISENDYFQDEKINFHVGQVIFVRKNINVSDNGQFHCYENLPTGSTFGAKVTGNLNWVDLNIDSGIITIANLHGLWQKNTSKKDTPERFTQSSIIKDFFNKKEGKKILCGDFNLSITGDSLKILEEGMVNLIKKYDVQGTRSSFYKKDDKFADYILTSPNIEIVNFKVLQDEVSDHLPLSLEFK